MKDNVSPPTNANSLQPKMHYLIIDALPLILEGGISNYLKPFIENVLRNAGPSRQVKLLFRLSLDQSRHQLYKKYLANGCPYKAVHTRTYFPDRIINNFWKHCGYLPVTLSKKSGSIFIATTEMVPRSGKMRVGWIVYDLTPLRIPKYFDINCNDYHDKMKSLAKRTDYIFTISNNSKNDIMELLNYPGDRICVIYPGVTPPSGTFIRSLTSSRQRPYVYYLGSLALNKNVDGMLRIFSECVNHYGLDYDIVLTGKDFCGYRFWNQLIKELNIEGRVHITGWIPDDERENYLTHAAMLWQFSWYEGFGLPVLEAASRGIPVLYANRGALPEILNNPEQEIDPENEKEAAGKAAQALQSTEILARWGKTGLQKSTEFSWDKSARIFIDLLDRLS